MNSRSNPPEALPLPEAFRLVEDQDIAAIEQLNDRFTAALNSGDISAITDMVTDNAILLPARGKSVKGSNIQKYLLFLAQQMQNAKFLTTDLDPIGPELAREVGTFSFRTRGPNSLRRIVGRYLFLWQRVAGEWKLSTFVWSRDPEAGPMPAAGGPTGE